MKQTLFMDAAESIIKEKKYPINKKKKKDIETIHFLVDESNKKNIKRTVGNYYNINYSVELLAKFPKRILKEVESVLNKILKSFNTSGKTLIVGLGNSSILADAIGPETTKKIIATNHYNDFLTVPKIALFVPEVVGKTGISSFKLIKMVVESLKPDTIIVIDSLATNNKTKLNCCIEINDTGIIPGSAIKMNKEINSKTFGIPVIAIGVPLMLTLDNELYTTPTIHSIIDLTSDIISEAINNIYLL